MQILNIVSGIALSVALAAPGFAQSVSALGGPAETPPSSYGSDQYVDSRGCVFIRAGYGGAETWVPRVTQSRQALCGQQPTGISSTAVTASAPSRPATPAPVQITPAPVAAATVAAAAAGNRVVVRQPVQVAVAPAAAPSRVVTAAPVATMATNCQGVLGSAAQYMHGAAVRCGPQSTHPADAARGIANTTGYSVASIPDGYRPAWDDGRLNPHRGLAFATPQGQYQMAQHWTDTVPMTGVDLRVVIIPDPVATSGQVTRSSSTPTLTAPVAAQTARPAVTAPVAAAPVQVDASHRYVEVARYSDRAMADQARAQLMGQGLPTRLGAVSGSNTLVLLAGPFNSAQSLGRTLNMARGLGYSGAVTRH